MKPLAIQHIQRQDSRYRRLTMAYICPSQSDAVCLWNKETTGVAPVQFKHYQLSNDEVGMR